MPNRTSVLVLLCLAMASPAHALSCLRPSVANTFAVAHEAQETYVMAVGRLTPKPGQTRPAEPANPNDRKGYAIQTRFEGQLATLSGFDRPAAFDVTVQVDCLGPWCGGLPTGEHLLFLERTTSGDHRLSAGPCPMFALNASPENRSDALACLQGRRCVPD